MAQVARQACAPQTSGSHARTTGEPHAPAPLQVTALVSVLLVHEALPHTVPATAFAHVPLSVQSPVFPQGGLFSQSGSGVPSGTSAHAPALSPTLHDWHIPQDAC